MSTLKSPSVAATGKNPPAVFWRKSANQFMAYIGYHLALKGKKQGTRVRTAHYLGRELRDALISACKIDQDWDTEVAYWKSQSNRSKPVWRTEDEKMLEHLTTELLASEERLISLEPDGDEQDPW